MPVTLQPTSLKYKNSNGVFQNATAIQGESPVVAVTNITGGHRITITDAEGPHSFDVMDGDVADAPVQSVNGQTGAVVLDAQDVGAYEKPVTGIPASDLAAGVIPEVPVQDVHMGGTSIVVNGIANIPPTGASKNGYVRIDSTYGINANEYGRLYIQRADDSTIKAGTNQYRPIVPYNQYESTFYGLAKAAGDSTQSASSNPVGTYTDDAKAAIQQMLDVPSTDDIPTVPVQDVQVNGTSVLGQDGVANVPLASTTQFGVVKIGSGLNVYDNKLYTSKATSSTVKAGTGQNMVIVPYNQHESTFYGLSKVAGVDLANETVSLGTYPDSAKAAIKTMLGVTDPTVTDVQVNGVSVLSNGVANVPIASASNFGTVKVNSVSNNDYGIAINDSGVIWSSKATNAQTKAGINNYKPIVPAIQHQSTFYGLAKAAGDTTQAASDNAVGTYTDDAKSAISQMLNGAVSVSGTTPTIAALSGIRYTCGEVATLDITPPASGDTEIIFSSGSTPTVLTVPSTIRWPIWFNPTSLVANTTYDIIITDGTLGMVMAWT